METILSAVGLLIIALIVYYGPEWFSSKYSLVKIEGVEYQITREDHSTLSIRFSLEGIEHNWVKSFDDPTLCDLWIEGFGKKEADIIKNIVSKNPNTQYSTFPKLPKNAALVLEGPQGSGKTRMAERVAFHAGKTQVTISESELLSRYHTEVMVSAQMWILDADLISNEALSVIKSIVGSEKIRSEIWGEQSSLIPSPSIVLCVTDASRFKGLRRFEIFKL